MCQDFHLNRVNIEEGSGAEASPAGARPKKKNKKSYDLTAADKFWQKHKGRWAQHAHTHTHVCYLWLLCWMFEKCVYCMLTHLKCVCVCMCSHAHSPFPEVAESVQEELDTYRAQEDEVKRLKSIMVRPASYPSPLHSQHHTRYFLGPNWIVGQSAWSSLDKNCVESRGNIEMIYYCLSFESCPWYSMNKQIFPCY